VLAPVLHGKSKQIRADPKYFLSLSVRCSVTADSHRSWRSSRPHTFYLARAVTTHFIVRLQVSLFLDKLYNASESSHGFVSDSRLSCIDGGNSMREREREREREHCPWLCCRLEWKWWRRGCSLLPMFSQWWRRQVTLKGQGRDAYSTVCIVHWLDLVLRFSGSAHVSWSEAQTTYIKGSAPTVSCRNNETFLHFSLSLLNKGI